MDFSHCSAELTIRAIRVDPMQQNTYFLDEFSFEQTLIILQSMSEEVFLSHQYISCTHPDPAMTILKFWVGVNSHG